MKGLKWVLASISIFMFLIIVAIGILTGGGKGAESLVPISIIPLIIMVIGLLKKD